MLCELSRNRHFVLTVRLSINSFSDCTNVHRALWKFGFVFGEVVFGVCCMVRASDSVVVQKPAAGESALLDRDNRDNRMGRHMQVDTDGP